MLDKIWKEVNAALKEMYLDVANNYDISDLHSDSDKVACVASRCRHVAASLIEKIFRKHMNDGWISVEERLPTEEERIGGYDRGIPWSRRLEVAYMTDTVEYTFGYYDGFKFYDKRHRKIKNVIAWKIHEPYRPEKGTE